MQLCCIKKFCNGCVEIRVATKGPLGKFIKYTRIDEKNHYAKLAQLQVLQDVSNRPRRSTNYKSSAFENVLCNYQDLRFNVEKMDE